MVNAITITFGRFLFDGKSHTVNKDGVDTFRLKFKDDHENKLSIKCAESDFEKYDEGDYFEWDIIQRQSTLDQEESPV